MKSDFTKYTWVTKGRKLYLCWWCNHGIARGSGHYKLVGYSSDLGGFLSIRECKKCYWKYHKKGAA